MLERLRRASPAAALLAVLLIPAAGSTAGPDRQLEEVKEKLEDLRAKIETDLAAARSIKERITIVERQVTAVQIEINRLDRRVAVLESEVRDAQARIDHTQAEIDAVEKLATAQAVALYKAGTTDTLDALLNSESLTELEERAQFLGVAAEKNTDELVRFGRLRLEIKDEKADLFARKDALDAVLASRQDYLAERESLRERLEKDYRSVRTKLAKRRRHEGQLESAAQRITRQILASQAPSVASLGISASGFIWPINGGVTSPYGPRWGRMHTGIDIDGYSGQPVAASKPGRVILAEYYSGYGNAVILDHGGGVATLYAHLSAFAVSVGDSVGQGRTVGAVGCTGSCTGDHLHFEVRINGDPVDPLQYLP